VKVYVHPTPSARDNIPGFLALLQQKSTSSTASSSTDTDASSLLLAWVPESSLGDAKDTYIKVDLSEGDGPPKQTSLVPAPPTTTSHSSTGAYPFAIPVSEVYSLQIRPPNPRWWFGSVIINPKAGDSFPALFFHDSESQSTINQRKRLARETFDPFDNKGNVFWGGDELLRWLRRYVPVDSSPEANVYLVNPTEDDKKGFGKPTPDKVAKAMEGHKDQSVATAEKGTPKKDAGMDPLTKALKEARWNVLEKLSQVTTFTRRTAQAVADNKNLPPQVRRLMQNPDVQTVQDEFDSARVYLARWAMSIAEQSDKDRTQRIWSANDILQSEDSEVGEFEILDMEAHGLADKRHPVTLKEWEGFFNLTDGRLQKTPDEVKERIFHGGLDPNDGVRKEAWLFLLGVHDWDSSRDDRKAKLNSLQDEYVRLKGAWWDRMMDEDGTLEEREWWKEQKMRIGKSARDICHSPVHWLTSPHFLGFAM